MKHEIKVPEVSEGVTEGTVVDIAVAVGDAVDVDQTLVEFETDKAVIAIPSPLAGQVAAIKVAVGDSVAVGAVIMLIEAAASSAEEVPEPQPQAERDGPAAAAEAPPQAEVPQAGPDKESEPVKETEPVKLVAVADKPPAAAGEVDLATVRRGDRVSVGLHHPGPR